MTELTSKVFAEYPVKFTGTYKKECPDGVTMFDAGVLPLTPPTINLTYNFPFCHLDVRMKVRGDTDNTISAGASVDKFPKKELFDPRMDELYLQGVASVEKAYKEVRQDISIASAYPDLLFQGIFDMNIFYRHIYIEPEGSRENQNRMLSVENSLSEKYGSTLDFDKSENLTHNRQVTLGNNAKVSFYAFGRAAAYIIIGFPVQFPKQEAEEIRDFILEHETMRERCSINPYSSGDLWRLVLKRGGYYILDKMFKEDIDMLPK